MTETQITPVVGVEPIFLQTNVSLYITPKNSVISLASQCCFKPVKDPFKNKETTFSVPNFNQYLDDFFII